MPVCSLGGMMGAQRVVYQRCIEEILMSAREHLASLEIVFILPAPPLRTRVRLREEDGYTLRPRKSKDPKAIWIALGSECCAEASLTSLLFLLDLNQGPSD